MIKVRHAKVHPLYSRWKNMRRRCLNAYHPRYKDWGGRGIGICTRWDDFWAYAEDIERLPKPSPRHCTIDRIDNDKGYEPGNVRWATIGEQNANQRARCDSGTGIRNLQRTPRGRWLVLIQRNHKRIVNKTLRSKTEALKLLAEFENV